MLKITLKTLFDAIQKNESRADARFDFLKEQIQNADSRAESFKVQVQTNHAELRRTLNAIRDQTAHITERVAVIERVQKDI